MAVYTHLGAEELASLIDCFDVGKLTSAKGIAEGVSNSNWLIETTCAQNGKTRQFVLTMYERRIELADLPYFLGLLDHLAERNCAVPKTIHDSEGAPFRMVDGKAVALIEYLPGISPNRPTVNQARSIGSAIAQIHKASADFSLSRTNRMGFADNLATLKQCGIDQLALIDPQLPEMIGPAQRAADLDLTGLPISNIHADLFPDNALMLGDTVSGIIDFYFACTDIMALDLAVTHAAWCFDDANNYNPELGDALIAGYQEIRPLTPKERQMMPQIAMGAALRFVASRAEDWLDTPADALVTRKNPMQFAQRWQFYREYGAQIFNR